MQYLGGKHRLAKRLVAAMRAEQGDRRVWEPFCGGLSMTVEFAKRSGGVASDVHPALIALYTAMRSGWVPPLHVSEADYRAAKALPDSDPLKAFVGFGCSFGGRYFQGYARGGETRAGRSGLSVPYDYAQKAAVALSHKITGTLGWSIRCASFFDVTPRPIAGFVYCDPPYRDRKGYGVAFDHSAFWASCQGWARHTPVYVSEFACPVRATLVTQIERRCQMPGGVGVVTDRLFRIEPR